MSDNKNGLRDLVGDTSLEDMKEMSLDQTEMKNKAKALKKDQDKRNTMFDSVKPVDTNIRNTYVK